MKVFLDANVLVSAFATRGLSADVLELVLTGHELIAGRAVLAELERALRRKIKLPVSHCTAIADFVSAKAARIVASAPPADCRADEDDRLVLGEALAGGAEVFVTGDADLLTLAVAGDLRIVAPREFWQSLQSR